MSDWAGFWIAFGLVVAAHFATSSAETITEYILEYLKWKSRQ